MSTLLLRLAAPLQSWGVESKFERRTTGRAPSRSGVIGLCAAALGIRRWDADALKPFEALTFGVRVDKEGRLLSDYQTAQSAKSAYVTHRHYLSDAAFLVGLETPDTAFLASLDAALRAPAFPLFLGRRSCPPEGRLALGLRDLPLKEALLSEAPPEHFRLLLEQPDGALVRDVPLSFDPVHRRYGARRVWEGAPQTRIPSPTQTTQDAFAAVKGGI
ncbi:MAG: type I-E CRISPR-associated protein Cas5/CasD [Oscillospiraceae bacterium]|jgi:CRISPR system Cascade subunit CasD|nr:type I-E CRISPR-associated protein Cas5/CasD [Oscillospiraceae bacterium]